MLFSYLKIVGLSFVPAPSRSLPLGRSDGFLNGTADLTAHALDFLQKGQPVFGLPALAAFRHSRQVRQLPLDAEAAARRKKFRSAPFPPDGENCARSIPSSFPHATRFTGLARGIELA
jgi:hypothetical protein